MRLGRLEGSRSIRSIGLRGDRGGVVRWADLRVILGIVRPGLWIKAILSIVDFDLLDTFGIRLAVSAGE